MAHAEDCKSLYIGSIPVPASKISFNTALFRLSSAVEQSAVNRSVACSNQAAGAIKKDPFLVKGFFLCFYCLIRAATVGACLRQNHIALPCINFNICALKVLLLSALSSIKFCAFKKASAEDIEISAGIPSFSFIERPFFVRAQ